MSVLLTDDISKNCCMRANSVDSDQMPHSVAYDLGAHCLFRPVCPSLWVCMLKSLSGRYKIHV